MQAAYDAIYFELKGYIENGTYPYRSLLPSESMLVNQYGCAHNTVRKSLAMLAAEGYVQPVHGKGVRVIYLPRPSRPNDLNSYPSSEIESFREVSTRNGLQTTTNVLKMERVKANSSESLRYFFEGESLIHIERTRVHDGQSYAFESNYFRADVVDGITKEDAEYSVYHYIRDVKGGRIATSRRWISVEPATDRDRELLDIDGVSHVAVVRVLTFDGDGLLCESSEIRLHPRALSLEQTSVQSRVGAITN